MTLSPTDRHYPLFKRLDLYPLTSLEYTQPIITLQPLRPNITNCYNMSNLYFTSLLIQHHRLLYAE
jgi:hypothetical protein